MKLMLSNTEYFIRLNYTDFGVGNDDLTCDSMDRVVDVLDTFLSGAGTEFRVIRVDMNPETNLPEHVSDETEEAMEAIKALYAESEIPAPAMNGWEPAIADDGSDAAYDMMRAEPPL